MFKTFVGEVGRIDILISNAGLKQDAPVTEMTLKQWNTVLDTNLTGAFLCAREAISIFIAQRLMPAWCC